MSERRSFRRKVGYLLWIVLLLVPLSMLSMPATRGGQTGGSAGGKLARFRAENQLSQASLGEIDPASEAMKLGTLGMRGVAVSLLWGKSHHYKKTKDWVKLSATLEQMAKLQPNFIAVWRFQAWNLSYNVSAEFDGYRDRYYWVIRGINFLKGGVKYNEDDPRMLWDIGWFIGQKIGRADEHKEFRKLFKEDDEFHEQADYVRSLKQRDNWLVAREWARKAIDAVDYKGKTMRGKNPLVYEAGPAMSLMNYAEALEEDGIHGEVARKAWNDADQAWEAYGLRSILASDGSRIQLADLERKMEEAKKYTQTLDELMPELREKMVSEARAALTDKERAALDTSPAERSREQYQLAREARSKVRISSVQLAARIKKLEPQKAAEALRLARLATDANEQARMIRGYREQINFDYWRMRSELEQSAGALEARKAIFDADQQRREARMDKARQLYEQGFAKWREVIDRYPLVYEVGEIGDVLVEAIARYRSVLSKMDEPFPDDFQLWDIVERHDQEGLLRDVQRKKKTPAQPGAEPPAGSGEPPQGSTRLAPPPTAGVASGQRKLADLRR